MKLRKHTKKLFCFIILLPLIFISLFLIISSKNKIDNTNFLAIKLDGADISYFPNYASGNYTALVNCNNATGKWKLVLNRKNNTTKWNLEIDNIVGDVSCDLEFKSMTEADTLINVIKNLETKTNNNGVCSDNVSNNKSACEAANANWWGVYDENGLRFEGSNPNNYVLFNDQLWRIIGYLPIKDANNNNKQLVKIIKDTGYKNASSYLNSNFLYSTSCKKNREFCDYSMTGLTSYFRSMIEAVQWYTGAGGPNDTADTRYNREKNSSTNVSGGTKVNVMNISDFAYGVLKSDCARTVLVQNYKNLVNTCINKNWLFYREENTIAGRLTTTGGIEYASSKYSRPVVHLNENVYVVSGSGTSSDPYILDI